MIKHGLWLGVVVVGFAVAGLIPACDASAPPSAENLQEIDALAAAEFAQDSVGSLTIGVIAPSRELWTKSYGFADGDKTIPATQDTIYRIGSITKQFTALMLLQLVERGKVHLSDPVAKYFPEVDRIQGRFPSAPPITLIQLATHTAGLAVEPDELEKYTVGPVDRWESVLLTALPHTRYVHEPGTRFSYSNIGYAILGAALARAAKQPYTQYVQENIFQPLGMTHTAFELTEAMKPRLAAGLHIDDGRVDAAVARREHEGRGYKVPNGAAYTTVRDLAAFVSFELGNGPETVLKKDHLSENFDRLIAAHQSLRGGYGLGFETFRRGDLQSFGHSGRVTGYEASAYFDRAAGTGIVLLRSATGGSFVGPRLCSAILEKLAAKQPAEPRQPPR
ncbi:MAG TPA: serine hydrolase domain-containing protein [Thermoanaerobaculia bacterium]|nr:serine hydrolase domain-containing protein [Thermoanaerobaculia bacterium]